MVKRAAPLKAWPPPPSERLWSPLPTPSPEPTQTSVAPPSRAATARQRWVAPELAQAPVLDLMCSHFVLALATRMGPRFNLRRDLGTLLSLAGRHLVWPLSVLQRLRAHLQQRCAGLSLWAGHERLDTAAFMARHGRWQGHYEEESLFFFLDGYAQEAPKDVLAVLAATTDWLAQALRERPALLTHNTDTLAELLQLNASERALLLYGTLTRYQRELRAVLVEFKVTNAHEAHATLAELAGVDAAELGAALRHGARLERLGLVDNLLPEHAITDLGDLMKVSERLPPVLLRAYRDRHELMAVFTRPAARSSLGLDHFDFVRDDAQVLSSLLRAAVARREPGVNVLIYGPPGTGKTELARVVAEAAGLELFEVEYADRDGHGLSGRERYRALQVAQVFLTGCAGAALLFDEVEDVFPPVGTDTAQYLARSERQPGTGVAGKAWVNQILEHNPVPTLWITNRIDQIDPAFRRRFAYHLELQSPPPGARERLVRQALAGVPVSDALVARLSERPGLTPAQIRTAWRFADLARPETADAAQLEQLMERQLHHADLALGRRTSATPRPTALRYALDWLHTESRHPWERVLQALRASGHGSLCFHGPPGTGKTALAEHLAQALQRPLMVRQASDLVSKFVGETEQQMAAMFAQAEAEQAVLLLDEADSFLLDRRDALRPHEVSEVNEMLQGMERFRGIFICTTNLMERLDAAALRRFGFKIAFKPLRPDQRQALFALEALGDAQAPLAPAWQQRLLALDQLCLGDVAAVKRQAEILQEHPDPEAWLEQLEAEHRLKPEVRARRSVGFVP